jgi:hypothetical protein
MHDGFREGPSAIAQLLGCHAGEHLHERCPGQIIGVFDETGFGCCSFCEV